MPTNSARLSACNRFITRPRYRSTVFTLTPSRSAISRLLNPWANGTNTSRSRGVRPSMRACTRASAWSSWRARPALSNAACTLSSSNWSL